jgi:uncharacterized repeat protein (TIGR03803 family)
MRFAKRTSITEVALAVMLGLGPVKFAQAQTFTLLHTFAGAPDGASPEGKLVRDAAGNFYGTTSGGGNSCGYQGRSACGTVFKIDATSAETVLYRFTGGTNGSNPRAGLVLDAAGNLYGTTSGAATSEPGTIFKLDTTGTLTVLHSIGSNAGLVMDTAGNLYGSTTEGIFKLDPAGTFTVLDSTAASEATLTLDAAGNLYGTTEFGGITGGVCGNGGCGTVFKLDTTGSYTVLYSFTGEGNDGFNPVGGVVLDGAGNLWGTTSGGGAPNCGSSGKPAVGCGTVFKVSPTGGEVSGFSLSGAFFPQGGLAQDAAGIFYGTSKFAGSTEGAGTVFEIGPDGIQNLLHTFTSLADGLNPLAGVVLDPSGKVYGTAPSGGPSGFGTVFKIDPTGPQSFPLTVVIYGSGTVTGSGVDCSSNCSTWVGAGTTFTLTATPPAGGSFVGWVPPTCSGTGTCSVTINAAQTVGATFDSDFSISATALTPTAVSAGGSATSTISVVAAANGFFSAVALSCTVTPAPALAPTCLISPNSVMPGTTATLTVNTTAASTARMFPGAGLPGAGHELFYALCLPLIGLVATTVGFGSKQKSKGKLTSAALTCMLFTGLVFQIACGSSSSNSAGGGGSKGTPAGTYTVTVTGTYSTGSLVHTTPTMLTVQ